MRTDAIATLAHVREFLSTDILPSVPQSLRSELRSAVKLMEDIEREVDVLPYQLTTEANRLLDLCDQTGTASGESEAEVRERTGPIRRRLAEARRLHDLMDLHREARLLSTEMLSALLRKQERPAGKDDVIDAAARIFLRELRDQSAARQSWQSVFVPSYANNESKKDLNHQSPEGTV